jgi:hypothetical protein
MDELLVLEYAEPISEQEENCKEEIQCAENGIKTPKKVNN